MGNDVVRHKLDVLRSHCERLGRPYDEIEKTTLDTLRLSRDGSDGTMTASAAIDYFRQLAEMGIDQAIFNMPNVADPNVFDLIATEIAPRVERIQVSGRA